MVNSKFLKTKLGLSAALLAAVLIAMTGCNNGDDITNIYYQDPIYPNPTVSLQNWQAVVAPDTFFTTEVKAVAYGNGIFVAGNDYGVSFSSDGITWSDLDTTAKTSGNDAKIRFLNDEFWVCGPTGYLYHSEDGTDWVAVAATGIDNSVFDIAYNGITYIAVGMSASAGTMSKSTDKTTWSSISHAINSVNEAGFRSINYADSKFIATAQKGKAAYSVNGNKWNDLSSITDSIWNNGSNGKITSSAYGNGIFVMAGGQGLIARSTNGGTEWNAVDINTIVAGSGGAWINGLIFADNQFVGVGSDGLGTSSRGQLVHSTDGITWVKEAQPATMIGPASNSFINSVAYGNGRYVIVGGNSSGYIIAYTVTN